MIVLLIDDDNVSRGRVLHLLQERGHASVRSVATLQEGIEIVEECGKTIALAICSYRGSSVLLPRFFLELTTDIPLLLLHDSAELPATLAEASREAPLEVVPRNEEAEFLRSLERLEAGGVLASRYIPDSDFLFLDLRRLKNFQRLPADVYLRLAPGRYCKRFRKDDGITPEELDSCLSRGIGLVYVHKEEIDRFAQRRGEEAEEALAVAHPEPERLRETAQETLEIVHEIVTQIGFTPSVQELAKKAVRLTLKALGSNPELADIMRRLRAQKGRYITTHSFMLGEVACALASRLGWNSAPTFLKLTLSAFLHDLILTDNRLAQVRRLEDVTEENGFSPSDVQTVKLHPARVAGYSRQFHQMPPDVDVIVLEHHERPDGSGFPRGLFAHQISPLAAIFIVSHDLLDFFLEKRPANPSTNVLEAFLFERESSYGAGVFKKIRDSLRSGEPLILG